MDAQLENFNDFKMNIRNTYDLDEPGQFFMDFLLNIKNVYNNLKKDIRLYSINLDSSKYSNFSKIIISELDEINSYKDYKNIEIIKPWIEKYNFRYEGIDSILQIVNYPERYKEEGCPQIYHDLYGEGITNTLKPYLDELFAVQDDFLKFTKANLIDDIINLINKGINSNELNNKEDIAIDLSDSKGTEKIIMLEKLGVLKFLKSKEPFNLSTNVLASAISGFTGIKAQTVQSYINPMQNPSVNQKNNPLESEKTIKKVTQKLKNIGFKSQD